MDEGCICGHGAYAHAWSGAHALRLGTCDRCECHEFEHREASDFGGEG